MKTDARQNFPKISVVVPTFNEEDNITSCLQSIFKQNYPKEKLEVFVVDDNSTDRTLEKVKKYDVKVIKHNSKDPEVAKKLAFQKSSGDFFIYFDADIHLRGKNWFNEMLKPLLEDKTIAASFTRYYSDSHSTSLERFLNLDPLQLDPIYQYFTPSLYELVLEKRSGYVILSYSPERIPPAGLCLHRKELIAPHLQGARRFLELDLLVDLVEQGNTNFAYVPETGLYHHHVQGFFELMKKRSRNVTSVYLKDNQTRKYRWFNLSTFKGLLKVLLWIVWANLLLPSVIRGLYRSLRCKNMVALYEPFVSLFITDIIVLSFLTNKAGRDLLGRSLFGKNSN